VIDAILSVTDVRVEFGGVVAVDDVTFDVAEGQILGLIGPNGAGKTTLFDALCGFVSTKSGRVALAGRDITSLAPAERSRVGLGRSFQDAKLFSSLTVAETIACALERKIRTEGPISTVLGLPWVWSSERRVMQRVDELINLLRLGAFHDKFISELSTGSRRIVDLACVLAHEPTVLLLDEPSSGIAQRETEALGELLLRLRAQLRPTMIVIEHDIPLIMGIADRIVAMEAGRVIAVGSPAQIRENELVIEAYLGGDVASIERSGALAVAAS
jgi:branched-chain amino acid transport system ATP-binding protein